MMGIKSLLGVTVSVVMGSAAMGGESHVQKAQVQLASKIINFANHEYYTLASQVIKDQPASEKMDLVDLRTPVMSFGQYGNYTVLNDVNGEEGVLVSDVNYANIAEMPVVDVPGVGPGFGLSEQCAMVPSNAPKYDKAKVYASASGQLSVDVINVAEASNEAEYKLEISIAFIFYDDANQGVPDLVGCTYRVSQEEATEFSTEVTSLNYLNQKGYIPSDLISFSVDPHRLIVLQSVTL